MRFLFRLTLFAVVTVLVMAQPPAGDRELDRFRLELYVEALRQEPHQTEFQRQREAKRQEMIFVDQANRFVELWSKFTREFNERGTMNIKAARQVVKAFHQLEKNSAFPSGR